METLTINHVLPVSDKVRIKAERNSKGINWEISVAGATLDETLETLDTAVIELKNRFPQDER